MIYFIVVNYNSAKLIIELIDSIEQNISTQNQIIIVNNSPEDNLIYTLKSKSVIVIDSQKNLGFGRACNVGIQYVYGIDRQALIWLINPDATVKSNADFYILQCFSNEPSIAILGTKIENNDGKIWFSSGKFNHWTGYFKQESIPNESFQEPDLDFKIGMSKTRWVSGCSLIINLSRFDLCPSFDPQYFLYFEDVDFCERYYQLGYQIAITNKVLVVHKVSAIIGQKSLFSFENFTFGRLYFLYKNTNIFVLIIYLIYVPIVTFILLLNGQKNAIGRWKGLQKFIDFLIRK